MSDITPAAVEINLDGEPLTLRCTLEAASGINAYFQGFGNAHHRIMNQDLDAYVVLIRYGAGLDAKAAKDLPARIFATGTVSLIGPLARYATLLMTGGKAVKEGDAGEAGAGQAAGS